MNKRGLLIGAAFTPVFVALILALPSAAHGRVVRIEIQSRESVAAANAKAPAYEILRGVFFGELSPKDVHNSLITDLAKAARSPSGDRKSVV